MQPLCPLHSRPEHTGHPLSVRFKPLLLVPNSSPSPHCWKVGSLAPPLSEPQPTSGRRKSAEVSQPSVTACLSDFEPQQSCPHPALLEHIFPFHEMQGGWYRLHNQTWMLSIPDPLCVCCVTPGKGIVSLSLLHGPRGGIKSTLKPAVRTKWSSTQKGLGTYSLHTSTTTSIPPRLQQPHRQLEPQNLELSLAQGNSHYLPSKSGEKKTMNR